ARLGFTARDRAADRGSVRGLPRFVFVLGIARAAGGDAAGGGAEAGVVLRRCAQLAVPLDLAADAFVGAGGAVDDFLRGDERFRRVGGDLARQVHRLGLDVAAERDAVDEADAQRLFG